MFKQLHDIHIPTCPSFLRGVAGVRAGTVRAQILWHGGARGVDSWQEQPGRTAEQPVECGGRPEVR